MAATAIGDADYTARTLQGRSMRGKPFPIPVPNGGAAFNLPPHQAPPNTLVAGYNMFLDIDGLYKCRSGYAPLAVPGPATILNPNLFWDNDPYTWDTNPYTWQELGAGGSFISGGVAYQDTN